MQRYDTDHQAVRRAYGEGVPVVRPCTRCGSNCLLEECDTRNGEKASDDERYKSIASLRDPREHSRVGAVHGLSQVLRSVMSESLHEPPYYILVSLQHNSTGQSNALVHADIEYRYADDSPLSLLPRLPDEHVLVFNYDPASATKPIINSTSSHLALSGVKVLPAPGARVDDDASKNNNMYVLEVTPTSDEQYARLSTVLGFTLTYQRTGSGVESSQACMQNPRAIVARFKQRHAEVFTFVRPGSPISRNTDLRRILEYSGTLSEPNPQPSSPFP